MMMMIVMMMVMMMMMMMMMIPAMDDDWTGAASVRLVHFPDEDKIQIIRGANPIQNLKPGNFGDYGNLDQIPIFLVIL